MTPLVILGCEAPFPPLPDVPEPGTRTEHSLTLEPHRAAVCVAKNVDAMTPVAPEMPKDAIDRSESEIASETVDQSRLTPLNARIRPGKGRKLVEVHVITRNMLAVVEFSIEGAGSRAEVWTEGSTPQRRDTFVAAMLAGC